MGKDDERDYRAIQQLSRDWVAAVGDGDVDRLLDLVTDDIVFLQNNAPAFDGKAAVRTAYSALFTLFRIEQRSMPEETVVDRDWAFVRGTDAVTMTPHDGRDPISVQRRAIAILRRVEGGAWKLARGMTNAEPPPGRPH